ncbi:MAG: hypothetical protein D6675_01295, partial [Gemmatimonadetes bacterium]
MTKHTVYLMIIALLLCISPVIAGELDPSLQERMAVMDASEFIDIVIFLTDQADIDYLDHELSRQKATRQFRHETIVRELQAIAAETQDPVRNALAEKVNEGSVEFYRSYWIVNAFSARAQRAAILELADHPSVERIYFYAPMELIEPVAKRDAPSDLANTEIGLEAIRADEVWAMGINGAGTIVANLDTGVDGNHPALASRWRGNFAPPEECFYDAVNPNNHNPFDSGSHGTHTMGTITGLHEANEDTIGVAWGAHWIAAACIDYSGHPGYIASFEWMADPDGNPETVDDVPDVLSNSWGTLQYQPCDDLFWEAIDNCEAAGIIVLFAIGNEGSSGPIRRPGDRASTYYDSFTVGATSETPPYTIANFSTRGPTPCASGDLAIKPEVCAPGVGIRSSVPGGGYASWDGTSMATPHVAGVFALMRQLNPDIESHVAKQILMDTAMDLGATGEDNSYGWGLVDAYEAIQATYATLSAFEGMVTDAETDQPLRDATISTVEDPNVHALSDANGFYHLSLQPGEYHLTATRFGYYNYQSQVAYTIGAPETLVVNIQLDALPASRLSGHVFDANTGDPIPDAIITPLGVPIDPTTTDNEGYYEFDPIPGDFTYMIHVYSGDYDPQTAEVTVPLDQPAVLDFNLMAVESFEGSDGGFVPVGSRNDWEWGEPQEEGGPAYAYQGVNVWGTNLDGDYRPLANYSLDTPNYDLPAGADLYQLRFYHWYEINDWDGGQVQISTDNGDSWSVIHPVGDYPEDRIPALNGPGYTGESGDTDPEWVQADFDLNDYIGQTVKFRFKFRSTNSTARGWFIDNVVVYGSVLPPDDNATISGTITYRDSETALPATELYLTGDGSFSTLSDANGNYELTVPSGANYVLTPSKTGDATGISSFDAARVAQFSAGTYDLTELAQ